MVPGTFTFRLKRILREGKLPDNLNVHSLWHFQARCVFFINSGQTINIVEVINTVCYNFLSICLLIFRSKLRRYDYGFL